MRLGFKLLILALVVGVLLAGLLPPLLDQAHLRDDANSAAHAGAEVLIRPGDAPGSASEAVAASIAAHHGLKLDSVKVNGNVVTVVVEENVHTFMSGAPGLEHWFHLTVTQSASAYGPTE